MSIAEKSASPLDRLIQSYQRLFKGTPPAVHNHLPAGCYARVDCLCTDINAIVDDDLVSSRCDQHAREAALRFMRGRRRN